VIFGGLAIIVIKMTLDPLALRPRFSPGLPLSDVVLLYRQAALNLWQDFMKNLSWLFSLSASPLPRLRPDKKLEFEDRSTSDLKENWLPTHEAKYHAK
jgi:hypothetical protein